MRKDVIRFEVCARKGCSVRKDGTGVKFVHERCVLCAKMGSGAKFVHERGILCAELFLAMGFGAREW